MSLQTTVTTTGNLLTPDSDPITYQPPVLTNPNTVAQSYSIALTSSPSTVSIPSGSEFIGVRMPALNTVAVTLKGASGDTGISIHPTLGIPCLPLASTVSSVVLVAASSVTVQIITG